MKMAEKRCRCTHPGCRKLQIPGEATCVEHAGSDGVGVKHDCRKRVDKRQPLDTVVQMTALERLNLVKIETECVNFILQIRNYDLETEEIKRKLTEQLHSRAAHREQLLALAENKKAEQQKTVKEIAEKYKLEPEQMAYDPESGVLRDLRQHA